jgi:hypothetical protein
VNLRLHDEEPGFEIDDSKAQNGNSLSVFSAVIDLIPFLMCNHLQTTDTILLKSINVQKI